MKSNAINVQIDDIVKLEKDSKHYEKWKEYTFRVIGHKFIDGVKRARAVRNFKNEKLGSTNHYINEPYKNLVIIRKNPRYQEVKKSLDDVQDIEF